MIYDCYSTETVLCISSAQTSCSNINMIKPLLIQMETNPGYYGYLVEESLGRENFTTDEIERDLHRSGGLRNQTKLLNMWLSDPFCVVVTAHF